MAAVIATTQGAAKGLLSPGGRRGRRAAPWMALAVVALLAGIWAGLVLLGLPVSAGETDLAQVHGPLMALAFLDTLISVERAVALNRGWAHLAPVAAGLGGLATIAGAPLEIGPALLTVAGLGQVAIFVAVYRIQPALHTLVMTAGAACWPVAGGLWLAGWDVPRFVPWLAGFFGAHHRRGAAGAVPAGRRLGHGTPRFRGRRRRPGRRVRDAVVGGAGGRTAGRARPARDSLLAGSL